MEKIKQYRDFTSSILKVEDSENRFLFVASTDSADRHGTILNQSNWRLKNYEKNPIIAWNHRAWDYDLQPEDIIGKATRVWVQDGKLMSEIEFNPSNAKAVEIQGMVENGFLNTVSVGFIPFGEGEFINTEDGDRIYKFYGQELLEISVVAIPSQADATLVRKLAEEDAKRKEKIENIRKEIIKLNKLILK